MLSRSDKGDARLVSATQSNHSSRLDRDNLRTGWRRDVVDHSGQLLDGLVRLEVAVGDCGDGPRRAGVWCDVPVAVPEFTRRASTGERSGTITDCRRDGGAVSHRNALVEPSRSQPQPALFRRSTVSGCGFGCRLRLLDGELLQEPLWLGHHEDRLAGQPSVVGRRVGRDRRRMAQRPRDSGDREPALVAQRHRFRRQDHRLRDATAGQSTGRGNRSGSCSHGGQVLQRLEPTDGLGNVYRSRWPLLGNRLQHHQHLGHDRRRRDADHFWSGPRRQYDQDRD